MKVGTDVSPQTLPKGKRVAVVFRGNAAISTSEGAHPSALREAVIHIDRDLAIDVAGLPACRFEGRAWLAVPLDTKRARQLCGASVLGTGKAVIDLQFPENAPIPIPMVVTLFNGGFHDGAIVVFVHTFLTVPTRRAIVARVEIRRVRAGRYGWVARVDVPVIAGGSGSVTEVDLRVKRRFVRDGRERSFLSARCPDGALDFSVAKALFKNESGLAGVPAQSVLKGRLRFPCTPRE